MNARLDIFSIEFLCGAHSHDTAKEQGSFERMGPDRILQSGLSINGAVFDNIRS